MSDTIKIIEELQKQNELLREQNRKLMYEAIKLDYDLQIAKLKVEGYSDATIEEVTDKWAEEHKELLKGLD